MRNCTRQKAQHRFVCVCVCVCLRVCVCVCVHAHAHAHTHKSNEALYPAKSARHWALISGLCMSGYKDGGKKKNRNSTRRKAHNSESWCVAFVCLGARIKKRRKGKNWSQERKKYMYVCIHIHRYICVCKCTLVKIHVYSGLSMSGCKMKKQVKKVRVWGLGFRV